jgi:hypothetical protein
VLGIVFLPSADISPLKVVDMLQSYPIVGRTIWTFLYIALAYECHFTAEYSSLNQDTASGI